MEHVLIRRYLNRYGVDQTKCSKPVHFTDKSFRTILVAKSVWVLCEKPIFMNSRISVF